jgi:hypothetical protein
LMYRYHFANIAQYDYICKSHWLIRGA